MRLFVCTFNTKKIPKGMLVLEAEHILAAEDLIQELIGKHVKSSLTQNADDESLRAAVPGLSIEESDEAERLL